MTLVHCFGKCSEILQGEQLKILPATQMALHNGLQVLQSQFRSHKKIQGHTSQNAAVCTPREHSVATSFLKENVRNVDTKLYKYNPNVHLSMNSVKLQAAFFHLAHRVHF